METANQIFADSDYRLNKKSEMVHFPYVLKTQNLKYCREWWSKLLGVTIITALKFK